LKCFILTGTPGAGKTAILRQLEQDGFSVVEEAATDAIALAQARGVAEPWTRPSFIDDVVGLQRLRQQRAAQEPVDLQFHDRSAVCTAALADFLGYPISDVLARELARLDREAVFQKRAFFVRNMGGIEPTEARRISLEDALRFERIHEEIYRERGFEIVFLEPEPLPARVEALKRAL
jgi:predicted ATPase